MHGEAYLALKVETKSLTELRLARSSWMISSCGFSPYIDRFISAAAASARSKLRRLRERVGLASGCESGWLEDRRGVVYVPTKAVGPLCNE